MFYFQTFRINLNPSSVKKYEATLGNARNSKPKDSVTKEITVWRERHQKQNQDCQPCQIC